VSNTKTSADWTPPPITVVASNDAATTAAAELATRLQLTHSDASSSTELLNAWQLRVGAELPVLRRPDGVDWQIDFRTGKAMHRAQQSNAAKQPLARALGLSKLSVDERARWHIVDGTAGAGTDAWHLASVGAQVTLVEQHPVLHTLLNAAVDVATQHTVAAAAASRLTVLHGRLEAVLANWNKHHTARINAIYLDPMFPARRSSAAVKKPMQFIQALVGSGPNPDALLAECINHLAMGGVSRVVVKRPREAQGLALPSGWSGQKVVIDAGAARFDVYLMPNANTASKL